MDDAPILDLDAFDAAWPLLGVTECVPPELAPFVRHRRRSSDPPGPVDEGHRYRVGACGTGDVLLTIWSDKATGAPGGITCGDCGAGQLCGVGPFDHPATHLTAHGLRCAAHR